MSATLSPSSASAQAPARPRRSAGSIMLAVAGGALVVGAVATAAGMATSPPQDSPEAVDYIASLARDPREFYFAL